MAGLARALLSAGKGLAVLGGRERPFPAFLNLRARFWKRTQLGLAGFKKGDPGRSHSRPVAVLANCGS